MSTEHFLKTLLPYFDAVERGEKNFEVRRDDRGYQKGDILVLRCWNDKTLGWVYDGSRLGSPIKEMRKRIIYILTGGQFGIEPGFVVMGLEDEERR
ncbi:MAG: DUF3850 domain-containing protein [Bradyrhizobium sp.]|nr:DUF3850 domain-containing protein [Bradyrhizobium sp.]